jgi:uronate dehydrogenase
MHGGDTYMSRLLITGAAGNMGQMLRPLLRRESRILRLLDVNPIEPSADGAGSEELVLADITDAAAVADACSDVDAVLHLGGLSVEARFADIVRVNVEGTANLLEGARKAGVRRVLLASSNHAVGYYRRADVPPGSDGLPDDLQPQPDTFYGWSKAAIEALGALYHHRFGIDVIAVRIGTCFPEPLGSRGLATWLSPADAARLIEACLSAPEPGFRIIWGVSNNRRRWWSLSGARSLGYEPQDDAEIFAEARIAENGEPDPDDPIHDLVGGQFCLAPLGEPMR